MDTTDFSTTIQRWKESKCELLWSNSPGPFFGAMWKQAYTLGWVPKLALAGRAGMFYEDVSAWGGDIPWGVATDRWWDPSYPPAEFPGIGGTTPQSLFERWSKETNKPFNQGTGWGYFPIQVLANAIERAGTLDGPSINKAIGDTDMKTISGRAVFTPEEQHCRLPLTYGQWIKTDKPWVWELHVVYSSHDFIKPTAQPIFPIPGTTFK
jgi:ABC-type branched-subunit amino acid transport system substrate-binding protein